MKKTTSQGETRFRRWNGTFLGRAAKSARRGRSVVLLSLVFGMSTLHNAYGLGVILGSRWSLCEGGGSSSAADDATLYASITVGSGVSDGRYAVTVNAQTTYYTVSGGQATPNPLEIWGAAASYGETTTAEVFHYAITGDGVLDASEWTVTKTASENFSPSCPVQEVQHYTSTVNVLLGVAPPPPATRCIDERLGGDGSCQTCHGMARYSVHSLLVSLNIQDTPLLYTPPRGPTIGFTATYNQRDSEQAPVFAYSNLGPKWTFNWLSYVTDDPVTPRPQTLVYLAGGGADTHQFNSGNPDFCLRSSKPCGSRPHWVCQLRKGLSGWIEGNLWLSDGATAYPRRIFMTQKIDPAGNTVSIGYDSSFRVATITDAIGQATTISYELADDPLKITKVTDPFGRFATFEYVEGKLFKITDPVGIQSQFGYTTGTDSISSPDDTVWDDDFRHWAEWDKPMDRDDRPAWWQRARRIPGPSAWRRLERFRRAECSWHQQHRVECPETPFFWDKKAMSDAPGDYTKARVTHWLGLMRAASFLGLLPAKRNRWKTASGIPMRTRPAAHPRSLACSMMAAPSFISMNTTITVK